MIAHNRPTLGEREVAAASRVLGSGWVAPGPEVGAFERELAAALDLPEGNVAACSSGTAALFLALHVLDARGKRVAVPVYACLALRNAVRMAGAHVVLVDTPPDRPNVDARAIRAAGADLAIPVSSFGIPADDDAFAVVPAIDDACQALGARSPAGACGTRGAAGVFSFYASKPITTGGHGGAVVSKDRALIERVRDYLAFDARRDESPRFNLQLTDLAAAIGRVQLARYGDFVRRRADIWQRYRAAGLEPIDGSAPGAHSVRYRAVVRDAQPATTIANLDRAGITAIVPIEPSEMVAAEGDFPNAFAYAATTVSLPCYPSLSDAEVDRVIERLLRRTG